MYLFNTECKFQILFFFFKLSLVFILHAVSCHSLPSPCFRRGDGSRFGGRPWPPPNLVFSIKQFNGVPNTGFRPRRRLQGTFQLQGLRSSTNFSKQNTIYRGSDPTHFSKQNTIYRGSDPTHFSKQNIIYRGSDPTHTFLNKTQYLGAQIRHTLF